MRTIHLQDGADFEGWREAARHLLRASVPPEQVSWCSEGESAGLFADAPLPSAVDPTPVTRLPAEALALLQALICHRDPQRYGLAYRLLWRLSQGERTLLQLVTDPDVRRAREAEKNVRRDSHKMKAFVRFREVLAEDRQPIFVAWFEPEHYIVERVAPFFVRRFTGMRWSLLTPYRSAHWNGEELTFAAGACKSDAPTSDAVEDYWRTYFASIFNPARLKVQMMKSEMPMKYWKNLPEAALIPQLIREARPRAAAMIAAEPTVPRKRLGRAKGEGA